MGAEKLFHKLQHLLMILKTGIEITHFNLIKAIYDKSTAKIILKTEKLKTFFSKIRNKTRMSTLTMFIQHSVGSPIHRNQQGNRLKNPNWKEVKLSLFADDMILYVKNPEDTTKNLLRVHQ